MAIRFNSATANAMLSGGFREAFAGATLTIRSGSQPGAASDSATGTAGVSITAPSPAFTSPSGGSVTLSGTWQGTANDSITAGWARLESPGGARVDFSAGGPGSGADLIITNNIEGVDDDSIEVGNAVTIISSSSITVPGIS